MNGEWAAIHPLIQNGTLSQRQAAVRLGVSKTTIHRLLVHYGGGVETIPRKPLSSKAFRAHKGWSQRKSFRATGPYHEMMS